MLFRSKKGSWWEQSFAPNHSAEQKLVDRVCHLNSSSLDQTQIKNTSSTGFYNAGSALGGQSVRVNLSSIKKNRQQGKVSFNYYLGNELVVSQANCPAGTWTTFPENKTHYPKSTATRNMLNRVCNAVQIAGPIISPSGAAIVFDPPSNIRVRPNGEILCSVTTKVTISVQEKEGKWYRSDYCGSPGYIHQGQLKF